MSALPLVGSPLSLGGLTITPVSDGRLRFRPTEFFPGTTDADWVVPDHSAYLDENGLLTLDMASFLVQGGDRTVLIDCGLNFNDGNDALGGHLPEALHQAHVDPDGVDVVLFTHLHLDHIGWASADGRDGAPQPYFPNATYRCHAADWEWARTEHPGLFASRLAPVEGRFEAVVDGETVAPGVTVREAPGHTPGHMVVVLSSGGDRAVLLGDAVHCPVQLTNSDWATWGDTDARLAARTREALLRELEGSEDATAAAHFPGLRFGRLLTGGEGRTWIPLS